MGGEKARGKLCLGMEVLMKGKSRTTPGGTGSFYQCRWKVVKRNLLQREATFRNQRKRIKFI